MNIEKKNYLFRSVSTLKGVGLKLSKYLKNKNIERYRTIIKKLSLRK